MVLNRVGYESMYMVEFFLFFGIVLWVGVVVLLDIFDGNINKVNGCVFCYFFLFIDFECKLGFFVYVYGVFGFMDNCRNLKWFGMES